MKIMWKYCGCTTFQIKMAKKTKEKKRKNESGTKSLTKFFFPLAHSSAHSSPSISKAPNLFNIFQIQKRKRKTKQICIIQLFCPFCVHPRMSFPWLQAPALAPINSNGNRQYLSLFLLLCTVILFYCKLCFGGRYNKATGKMCG